MVKKNSYVEYYSRPEADTIDGPLLAIIPVSTFFASPPAASCLLPSSVHLSFAPSIPRSGTLHCSGVEEREAMRAMRRKR
jgi:hypothetical protein